MDTAWVHIATHTKPRIEGIGENTIFSRTTPRARRTYMCDCCGEDIEKGTMYVATVTVGLEGPGFERWHVHGECYVEGLPMLATEHVKRPDWRWGP